MDCKISRWSGDRRTTKMFICCRKPWYCLLFSGSPSIHSNYCVLTTKKGSVIYELTHQCDSDNVGRTTQRLEDIIKQHYSPKLKAELFPKSLFGLAGKKTTKMCDSALWRHLLDNPDFAKTLLTTCLRLLTWSSPWTPFVIFSLGKWPDWATSTVMCSRF